ncbi:hypothetical protein [Desulfonema magnum]|uniref:DUF5666 domain-containing protein n=1 Tax=Desulfonema magnum TaxID=45655 RepID=A0A975BRK8_9BACT|nr:hypothetical protein [Desulfonema magnum]QTA89785.1 Uncharacterized protein dnm_058420 [Desulfonema magnum]
MRTYLFILILLFSLTPGLAAATDVFLGTVKAVKPESGEVVLEVEDWPAEDDKEKNTDTPKEITINISPDRLPENLSPGETVRIWGKYLQGDMKNFQVVHISGGGLRGGKKDPTGVRSRLGKGRGMFKSRMQKMRHRGHK